MPLKSLFETNSTGTNILNSILRSRMRSNLRALEPEKMTKKELQEYQQKLADAALDAEIKQFHDNLFSQALWGQASTIRQREILKDYEDNTLKPYLKQRFGNDTTAANLFKNKLLQPILQSIREVENDAGKITTVGGALIDSAVAGGSLGSQYLDTFGFIKDAVSGNRGAEAQANARKLIENYKQFQQDEEVRRATNTYLDQQAKRRAELEYMDPEGWTTFQSAWEQGSFTPIMLEMFKQWPQLLATMGASVAGAGAGGLVGGLPGAAIGGKIGGMTGGAAAVASTVANEIITDIYEAPQSRMAAYPVYQELAAQGLSDEQIRFRIAQDAVTEALPFLIPAGALSGILGPEALVTKTNLLQTLMRGGILRKASTGGILGLIEEGTQGATEQAIQTHAVNQATGGQTPLSEGLWKAFGEEAAVGFGTGLVGGAASRPRSTDSVKATQPALGSPGQGGAGTTSTVSPVRGQTVGGIQTPGINVTPSVPGGITNRVYNPNSSVTSQIETLILEDITEEVDRLHAQGGNVVVTDLIPLFRRLFAAFASGSVEGNDVEQILLNVQSSVNQNPQSTLDVMSTFLDWAANRAGKIVPPAASLVPALLQPQRLNPKTIIDLPIEAATAIPQPAATPEPPAPFGGVLPSPQQPAEALPSSDIVDLPIETATAIPQPAAPPTFALPTVNITEPPVAPSEQVTGLTFPMPSPEDVVRSQQGRLPAPQAPAGLLPPSNIVDLPTILPSEQATGLTFPMPSPADVVRSQQGRLSAPQAPAGLLPPSNIVDLPIDMATAIPMPGPTAVPTEPILTGVPVPRPDNALPAPQAPAGLLPPSNTVDLPTILPSEQATGLTFPMPSPEDVVRSQQGQLPAPQAPAGLLPQGGPESAIALPTTQSTDPAIPLTSDSFNNPDMPGGYTVSSLTGGYKRIHKAASAVLKHINKLKGKKQFTKNSFNNLKKLLTKFADTVGGPINKKDDIKSYNMLSHISRALDDLQAYVNTTKKPVDIAAIIAGTEGVTGGPGTPDSTSVGVNSGAGTNTAGVGGVVDQGGVGDSVGVGGTAPSGGAGGTQQSDAGTTQVAVPVDQPVGGSSGSGADGGSSGATDAPTTPGGDTGAGGITGETSQRDGGSTGTTGLGGPAQPVIEPSDSNDGSAKITDPTTYITIEVPSFKERYKTPIYQKWITKLFNEFSEIGALSGYASQIYEEALEYHVNNGSSFSIAVKLAQIDANSICSLVQKLAGFDPHYVTAFDQYVQKLVGLGVPEDLARDTIILYNRIITTLESVFFKWVHPNDSGYTPEFFDASFNSDNSFKVVYSLLKNKLGAYNLDTNELKIYKSDEYNTVVATLLHEQIHRLQTVLASGIYNDPQQMEHNARLKEFIDDYTEVMALSGFTADEAFGLSAPHLRKVPAAKLESLPNWLEKYIAEGKFPENIHVSDTFKSTLAQLVSTLQKWITEVVMALWEFIKKHLNSDTAPNHWDLSYSESRGWRYAQPLPDEAKQLLDKIFTGYTPEIRDILNELSITVDLHTQTMLERNFNLAVQYDMQFNNMTADDAVAKANEQLQDHVWSIINTPATNITVALDNAEQANIDGIIYNQAPGMATVHEAMTDSTDLTSPLAQFGATDLDTTYTMHELPPDVQSQVTTASNGIFLDEPSMVVHDSPGLEEEVEDPSMQQLLEHVELYNRSVPTAPAPQAAPTVPPAPSPQSLAAAALVSRLANYRRSVLRGITQAVGTHNAFVKTVWTGEWVPGRWAAMATKLRKNWVDGGAHFRTWCLRYMSNKVVNPDHTPVLQSFNNLSYRIDGAARLAFENAIQPITNWAMEMAGKLNVDPDVFMSEIGDYHTALHTIEASYKQREMLEREVQQALLLPPGNERIAAVRKAKHALDQYLLRQNPVPGVPIPNVKLVGGRSINEAQTLASQVLNKYGRDVCDEGLNLLMKGYTWVTQYLLENGQLDQRDVNNFGPWNYYCALTTKEQVGDGAVNDITYYTPRQDFHRYGSTTPAQNAYAALVQYASRASRNVGMQEFAQHLRSAYLRFAATPGTITSQNESGNIQYFNGIAMVPEGQVAAIRNNAGASQSARAMADALESKTALVIRVLERDDNGEYAVKSFRVLFDNADVHEAVRNPFYSSDPDVFRAFSAATSGMASMYTRLNPTFPIVTMFRDMWERNSYLPTKQWVNEQGQVVYGSYVAARMSAFIANPINFYRLSRYATTGASGSEYLDAHLRDFEASGINTSASYSVLLSRMRRKNITDVSNAIPESIKSLKPSIRKALWKTLGAWSDFFYSLPAFAQFIKMREAGISLPDTVDGVTELMNTAMRGKFNKPLSAFFPFINPIGQTAANTLGALGLGVTAFGNHPNKALLRKNAARGWAVLVGSYLSVSILLPLIKSSLGDEEEGERQLDSIPLAQLSSGVPVGTEEGMVRVPIGFGPTMWGAMLAYGVDRVWRGRMTWGDLGFELMTTAGKTLVPNSLPAYGFKEDPWAYVLHAFSPLWAQPLVQVATRKTYSGTQTRYDRFNRMLRDSDTWSLTTHQNWSYLAKMLYDGTNGFLDVTPEEMRTVVNGYTGGLLRAISTWIESDPMYSNPLYRTTREQLGPFWTTIGATSIYNAKTNLSRSSFYEARNHYERRIRDAGLGELMVGEERDKRNILFSAGFTQEEVDDIIHITSVDREISNITSEYKKKLDALLGPDMDETEVRTVWNEWAIRTDALQQKAVDGINFYRRDLLPRYNVPDEDAAAALRREVPEAAAVAGTIDLMNRQSFTAPIYIEKDRDGLYTLYPADGPQGQFWNREDAWKYYLLTGQHLGKYRTLEAAEKYVKQLQK